MTGKQVLVIGLMIATTIGLIIYLSFDVLRQAHLHRKFAPQFVTVDIDGHKFIKNYYSNNAPVIHHPDCPCGKAR